MEGSTASYRESATKAAVYFPRYRMPCCPCLVLGGGGGWATKDILLSDGEVANFFAIWPELLSLLCLLQRYPFVASVFYNMLFYHCLADINGDNFDRKVYFRCQTMIFHPLTSTFMSLFAPERGRVEVALFLLSSAVLNLLNPTITLGYIDRTIFTPKTQFLSKQPLILSEWE